MNRDRGAQASTARGLLTDRQVLPAVSVRSRLMLLTAVFGVLVMIGGVVALLGLRDSLASTERNTTAVAPAGTIPTYRAVSEAPIIRAVFMSPAMAPKMAAMNRGC